MSNIVINKTGDNLYEAEVSLSPETKDIRWRIARALPAHDLVEQLYLLGEHQQDIGDAFYECDPDWVKNTSEN